MLLNSWLPWLKQRLSNSRVRRTKGKFQVARPGQLSRMPAMAPASESLEQRMLLAATYDNTTFTPQQLAQSLAGSGVTISNVTLTGNSLFAGTFTGGASDGLGLDQGIVLSTGDLQNLLGPNDADDTRTGGGGLGDTDLDGLTTSETEDATVLEFDFVTDASTLTFSYVFGSEEYNEFAGDIFNDVFGFFVDGINIAFVPGTSTPVAINNVNSFTNATYFRNNDFGDFSGVTPHNTELDGFTAVFQAVANVTPGISHRIKLAIADAGDDIFDSAVYLASGSFVSAEADVQVTVEPPSTTVLRGGDVNLTYTVTNNSTTEEATGVIFSDVIPSGLSIVSVSSSQGTAVGSGGVVTANLGSLAPTGTATVTVTLNATVSGVFLNTANVGANQFDENSSNNSASTNIIVNTPQLHVIDVTTTNDVVDGAVTSLADLFDNPGADGFFSLREAVIAANATAGDCTIIVPAGTYTLTIAGQDEDSAETGDLDIAGNLTIYGAGQATTIIQAGTSAATGIDRVFDSIVPNLLQFFDLTIRHGNPGTSNPDGSDDGAGLLLHGGTAILTRVSVSNNTGYRGSGIDAGGGFSFGTVNLIDSKVENNVGFHRGGGISLTGGATLVSLNSSISNNSTTENGGGLAIHNTGPASATLVNTTVSGNTASNFGGGILNFGNLEIVGSTISFNSAGIDGGGVHGVVTITNSTISGNSAGQHGGGMVLGGGSILNDLTVVNNSADSDGNGSGLGGGIITADSNGNSINNTIVAGNTVGVGVGTTPNDLDAAPGQTFTITSAGNNLIGDPNSSEGIANGVNGNIVGTDDGAGGRMLLPLSTILNPTLASNGGPTLTHALVPGSPAIDAGNNALIPVGTFDDQRGFGFARINGARVDIGALEAEAAPENTAPILTANGGGDTANLFVNENETFVSVMPAFDAESPPQVLTYSITGGADADLFDIDPDTDDLSFIDAPDFETPLDSDGDNVYVVTVTVSDGALSDSQTISVHVLDEDETPDFGSVSGLKWNDLNGDGYRGYYFVEEVGFVLEPALSDWRIYVDINNNEMFDAGEPNAVTGSDDPGTEFVDETGRYTITNIPANAYWYIREEPTEAVTTEGWVPSRVYFQAPNGVYYAYIYEDYTSNGLDFGNYLPDPASGVFGTKWHDHNADSYRDPLDEGLEGWTIYLDANGNNQFDPDEDANHDGILDAGEDTNENGVLDAGDPFDVTDASGAYAITGVLAGSYTLREVQQAGWEYRSGGGFLFIHNGPPQFPFDFANFIPVPGTISGVKFHDYDGDTNRDVDFGTGEFTEPGLAGWTIFLDLNFNNRLDGPEDQNSDGVLDPGEDVNFNGVLDAGEPFAVTQADDPGTIGVDETGQYTIENVPWGNHYVREVAQSGWLTTGYGTSQFFYNGGAATGINFGNFQLQQATIRGVKFDDRDGDGTRDTDPETGEFTEPGLEGWTIFLDDNNNGVLDEGEVSTLTDEDGAYEFAVDPYGAVADVGANEDQVAPTPSSLQYFYVAEVQQAEWRVIVPSLGRYQFLYFSNGEVRENVNFANQEREEAKIRGTVFVDADGDGLRGPGERGLAGVTVYLDIDNSGTKDPGEPSVVTSDDLFFTPAIDETGTYQFTHLAKGTYHVRAFVPSGMTATQPADSEQAVTVSPIGVVAGIDFGNVFQLGEIHGVKFADYDGDGEQGEEEPGIPGVTIYIDVNRDGVLDEGDISTTTMIDDPGTEPNEDGMYWFQGLIPGGYVIREVVPEGSIQTFPLTTGGILYPDGTSNPPFGDVDPTSITTELTVGQMYSDEVSLTLPTTGSLTNLVDVFLLFDDTGSFSGNGPIVAGAFPGIIANLQAALPGVNFAFGVGRFEEYGSFAAEDSTGRPFILNHPILATNTPGFADAIQAALNRYTPGYGGDGPETLIEALYQTVTGVGFDGNDNGSTLDSGPAGLVNTQNNPGGSGDVPTFGSFTDDPTGPVLLPSGNIGGVGFRPGALPIILAATDVGTAYQPNGDTIITGVGGITLPISQLTQGSRPSTPGDRGATIQDTITALNALGALVIGLGTNDFAGSDPRQVLEAIATLTGSVNQSASTIANGTSDPVDPNDPFYFLIQSGVADNVSAGIVAAIQSALSNVALNVTVRPSDPSVQFANNTGTLLGLEAGQTATFDIDIIGDGTPRRFDLEFVREGTNVVLGSIPVVVGTPIVGDGYHFVDLGEGEIREDVNFGNVSEDATGAISGTKFDDIDGDGVRDLDELGLAGWTIFVDTNNDGDLDEDELSAVTNADDPDTGFNETGTYTIANIPIGTRTIREVVSPESGWVATTAAQTLLILPGQIRNAVDFGNAQLATITGFKFEDVDANGVYDSEVDHPLADITFELTGVDGLGNEVTLTATTNEDGEFSFVGLLPSVADEGEGSGYTIEEILPLDHVPTTDPSVTIDVFSGLHYVASATPGAPSEILIDFEAPAFLSGTVLDPNGLAAYGISNIVIGGTGSHAGGALIQSQDVNGDGMIEDSFNDPRDEHVPSSGLNVLVQTGTDNDYGLTHSLTFVFSTELSEFGLSRMGTAYSDNSTPEWSATFYNSDGDVLGSFGGPYTAFTTEQLVPKAFTFVASAGESIASMKLESLWLFSTFRNIPVDDFRLTPISGGAGPENEVVVPELNFGDAIIAAPTGSISGIKWEDLNANGERDVIAGVAEVGWTAIASVLDLNQPLFGDPGLNQYPYTVLNGGIGNVSILSGFSDLSDLLSDPINSLTFSFGDTTDPYDDQAPALELGAFDNGVEDGIAKQYFELGEASDPTFRLFADGELVALGVLEQIVIETNTSFQSHGYGRVVFTSAVGDPAIFDQIMTLTDGTGIVEFSMTTFEFDGTVPLTDGDGSVFIANGEITNVDGGYSEPVIEGWEIILITNVGPDVMTLTDVNGFYSFTGLPDGEYIVTEEIPLGWQQTYPANVPYFNHLVTIEDGAAIEDVDFGNHEVPFVTGSISGQKWQDLNGDGIRQLGTGDGVSVTLFETTIDDAVEMIGNGVFDPYDEGSTEPIQLGFDLEYYGQTFSEIYVSTNGFVSFGSSYFSYEPNDFAPEVPMIAAFWADILSEFGEIRAISGLTESGSPYFQVDWVAVSPYEDEATGNTNTFSLYLEDNPNGDLIALVYGDLLWTDEFEGPQIGFGSGSAGEDFVSLGRPIDLGELGAFANSQFVFQVDEFGIPQSVGSTGGQAEPGVDGFVIELYDVNFNLIAQTETHSEDLNEDGFIDPMTEQGLYEFVGVPLGVYFILEVNQPGWEQTGPYYDDGPDAFTYYWRAELTSEVPDAIGRDFSNQFVGELGIIQGQKWLDLNGDGLHDDNEPGINGWEIELYDLDGNYLETTFTDVVDLNHDGFIDPIFETGVYQFFVDAGTYQVAEVQQLGYHQTFPVAPAGALLPDIDMSAAIVYDLLADWSLDTSTIEGTTLLRLSAAVPNLGAGPIELRGGPVINDQQLVYQRIYNSDGTFTDVLSGEFEYHDEHGHFHFLDYADYHLRAVEFDEFGDPIPGEIVASGEKVSFCLLDLAPVDLDLPGAPTDSVYFDCGVDRQGISVGWADIYSSDLPDQWIDVTGVPDGLYFLEIVIDPLNQLIELDETNNVASILIDLSLMGTPAFSGGGKLQTPDRDPHPSLSVATVGNRWVVSLEQGEVAENIDFGNQPLDEPTGAIHGIKWNDINGDGIFDEDEPGLAAVVIYLDDNGDGFLDSFDGNFNGVWDAGEGEQWTLTNEFGEYWFMNLPDGEYIVAEIVPDGWVQTAPTAGILPPDSEFDIEFVFEDEALSASQLNAFFAAAARWEEIIIGDLPDVFDEFTQSFVDDLVIFVSAPEIDGEGLVLGQAGPSGFRFDTFLPFSGDLELDIADVSALEINGRLVDVILHEIGHILGIGTIWTDLGLLVDAGSEDPRFIGTEATNAYNAIFGTFDVGVPVENGGGPGTQDSHWEEDVLVNELMTGYIDFGTNPISLITVGSLADMGYVVDPNAADPYSPLGPFVRSLSHTIDGELRILDLPRRFADPIDVDIRSIMDHDAGGEHIIGGEEATPGAYPWMAALMDGDSQFCGGTLINEYWVLTAAHCVEGADPGSFDVVLGRHDLVNDLGERIGVAEIFVHPNYDPDTFDFDIALLRLDAPSSQQTLRFATPDDAALFEPGIVSTVTGWGVADDGFATQYLREVQVPIVSNDDANASYNPIGVFITDNMLAAGFAEGGADSCQGDSGGPLMVPDGEGGLLLAGIVSFGEGCALPDYYGIYTRVSNFTSWITDTMANDGGDGGDSEAEPGNGVWYVEIEDGGPVFDVNFGNHQLAVDPRTSEIHGLKWEDVNQNGERDFLEATESFVRYVFDDENAISPDYIEVVLAHGTGMTLNVSLTTSEDLFAESVTLEVVGDDFGLVTVTSTPSGFVPAGSIISFGVTVVAPDFSLAGDFIELFADGFGVTELSVTTQSDDLEPTLDGWTIYLSGYSDDGEYIFQTTTTGPFGEYAFTGLPAGEYYVGEYMQTNWVQSAPVLNTGYFDYYVSLDENDQQYGYDFGNYYFDPDPRTGEIRGVKWNDLNGDGIRNALGPVDSEILNIIDEPGGLIPDVVDVYVAPGDPLSFDVTVNVPSRPLDLVLLQDLSGSFADDLPVLSASLFDFVQEILSIESDAQFGVASFVDKPIAPVGYVDGFVDPSEWDYVYRTEHVLTTDVGALQTTIDSLTARNGLDEPEAQLEALMHLAKRGSQIGFRAGADHIALLVTDSVYHVAQDGSLAPMWTPNGFTPGITNPNDGDANIEREDYPDLNQVRDALLDAGITPVFAVTPNAAYAYYDLVSQWGFGNVVILNYDSSNLVEAVGDGVRDAVFPEVSLQVVGDDLGVVAFIDPAVHVNAPTGSSVTFTVHLFTEEGSDVGDTFELVASGGLGSTTVNVSTSPLEPGLPNWTIYIDSNGNSQLDPEENIPGRVAVTDSFGRYALTGLRSGFYPVAEVHQENWVQTFPGGDGHQYVGLGFGSVVTGINFGNFLAPGEIHGQKWNDLNGDGIRQPEIDNTLLPEVTLVAPGAVVMDPTDDGSTGEIPLGFTLQFFGNSYNSFYINNNGNVAFSGPTSQYSPDGFPTPFGRAIIAPFWADVDTGADGGGSVHFTQGTNSRGHRFVQVDWIGVGYFNQHTDLLNTFSLYLENDPAGDIVAFFYGDMNWTTGDASGGTGGYGGTGAQIGFDSGDGTNFIDLGRPADFAGLADFQNTHYVFRIDADGLPQFGEVGLDGWVIELLDEFGNVVETTVTHSEDLNEDGTIDPVTESGLYTFDALLTGNYSIREVQRVGWEQTVPNADSPFAVLNAFEVYEYSVSLTDEVPEIEDLDFANHFVGVEPIAFDDQFVSEFGVTPYFVSEDGELNIGGRGVLENDVSPIGTVLTQAVLVNGPAHGDFIFNGDGTFTYTPFANYFGPDSFTYQAMDGTALSNVATAFIEVLSVNDAPEAHDDFVATNEDVSVPVLESEILANDIDVDGDPLTVVVVIGPEHGSLEFVPASNEIPDASGHGNSALLGLSASTVAGLFGNGVSTNQIAIVPGPTLDEPNITGSTFGFPIGDAPVTIEAWVNTTFTGFQTVFGYGLQEFHSVRAIDLATDETGAQTQIRWGFFNNDFNVVSPVFVQDGQWHHLAATYDRSVASVYVDGVFIGSQFVGSISTPAGSTFAIGNRPSTPSNPTYSPFQGAIDEVRVLDYSADVGQIEQDYFGGQYADDAPGTVALWHFDNILDAHFVYSPNPDYFGSDSFQYQAFDGQVFSNIATVFIEVYPVNDAPVAQDDSYDLSEDGALVVDGIDLASPLANDSDVDSAFISFEVLTSPANGDLFWDSIAGTFTYVPFGNFNGTDSFTYAAFDGELFSLPATVTLNVAPINDAPTVPVELPDFLIDQGVPFEFAVPPETFFDVEDGHSLALSAYQGDGSLLPAWLTFSDGAFHGTPPVDAQEFYEITVQADDSGFDAGVFSGSLSVTDSFIIQVILNRAPYFDPTDYSAEVFESGLPGSYVTTVFGYDNDFIAGVPEGITYEIVNGNTDGAFAIDEFGNIFVASACAVDFETLPAFLLEIRATDSRGLATGDVNPNAFVLINVLDVSIGDLFIGLPDGPDFLDNFAFVGRDDCLLFITESGIPLIDPVQINDVSSLTIIGGSRNDFLFLDSSLANNIPFLVTFHGNEGNDTLNALAVAGFSLLFDGGAGDDFADGGAGDDQFFGGEGDDVLFGNGGHDVILGQDGDDVLDGGDGDDQIQGGFGDDQLFGGNGNDLLYTDQGNNSADGQANNDTVISYSGSDALVGGTGVDQLLIDLFESLSLTLVVTNSAVTGSGISKTHSGFESMVVLATEGDDSIDASGLTLPVTMSGFGGNDTLIGGSQADELWGDGGNDSLNGSGGNDLLHGDNFVESGDDVLVGGAGNDMLEGNGGDDVYSFATVSGAAETDVITELVDGGTDRLDFSLLTSTIPVTINLANDTPLNLATHTNRTVKTSAVGVAANIENVTGGAGADNITGNAAANDLRGGAGNDTIKGGAGSDVITGDAGSDNLQGETDSDTYVFADATAAETDTVTETTVAGAGSADALDFSGVTANVTLDLSGTGSATVHTNRTIALGTGTARSNFEAVIGGVGNDTLGGGSGANTLAGGAGNDSITGGGGSDLLIGGVGNDTYNFAAVTAAETDTVVELFDEGTDTLNFSALTVAVTVNLSLDFDSENLIATHGAAATLRKVVTVDEFGVENIENATGGSGADTFDGGENANRFDGGSGVDIIRGHGGNDTLIGGTGNDQLLGGFDDDTYLFNASVAATETDTLTEFDGEGTDTLDFTGLTVAVTINLGSDTLATHGTTRTVKAAAGLGTGGFFENAIGGTAGDTITGHTVVGNRLDGGAGAGGDTIKGLGGNDTIIGGEGSDSMQGGTGDDTYVFANGAATQTDTINELSSEGNDTLDFSLVTSAQNVTVNLGSDTATASHTFRTLKTGTGQAIQIENVIGGGGNDSLTGSSRENVIEGRLGNDTITGAAGNDFLIGGMGNDSYLFATSTGPEVDTLEELEDEGSDTLSFSGLTTQSVTVNLTNAGDLAHHGGITKTRTVIASTAAENFENAIGGGAADSLTGNAANNALSGGAGNDTLTGFEGDDELTGGEGNDSMLGGDGNDQYTFATATAAQTDTLTELAGEGADTLNFATLTTAVTVNLTSETATATHTSRTVKMSTTGGSGVANIENAIGGSGGDTLTGNAADNVFDGGAGTDKLEPGVGNDTLIGGAGGDSLTGGDGNDTYVFVNASTAETDTVTETSLAGAGSLDRLDFSAVTTAVTIDLSGTGTMTSVHTNRSLLLGTGTTRNNFEWVVGGSAADSLKGGPANNVLDGRGGGDTILGTGSTVAGAASGDDTIIGGAGNDSLNGGNGNDTYVFANASTAETDTLTELSAGGTDTLDFTEVTTTVTVNLANNAGMAVHTNRTVNAATTPAGAGAANFENVIGGSGNDNIRGNSGNNSLNGGLGDDVIRGGAGNDILSGDDGDDTVAGEAGDDSIAGGAGNDAVGGGDGNDTVSGDAGFDLVVGGAGDDVVSGGDDEDAVVGNAGDDLLFGGAGFDLLASGGDVGDLFADFDFLEDFIDESFVDGFDLLLASLP